MKCKISLCKRVRKNEILIVIEISRTLSLPTLNPDHSKGKKWLISF